MRARTPHRSSLVPPICGPNRSRLLDFVCGDFGAFATIESGIFWGDNMHSFLPHEWPPG